MKKFTYGSVWKHLHERGEDRVWVQIVPAKFETPPRAWRRPSMPSCAEGTVRNTSTSVEKTNKLLTN